MDSQGDVRADLSGSYKAVVEEPSNSPKFAPDSISTDTSIQLELVSTGTVTTTEGSTAVKDSRIFDSSVSTFDSVAAISTMDGSSFLAQPLGSGFLESNTEQSVSTHSGGDIMDSRVYESGSSVILASIDNLNMNSISSSQSPPVDFININNSVTMNGPPQQSSIAPTFTTATITGPIVSSGVSAAVISPAPVDGFDAAVVASLLQNSSDSTSPLIPNSSSQPTNSTSQDDQSNSLLPLDYIDPPGLMEPTVALDCLDWMYDSVSSCSASDTEQSPLISGDPFLPMREEVTPPSSNSTPSSTSSSSTSPNSTATISNPNAGLTTVSGVESLLPPYPIIHQDNSISVELPLNSTIYTQQASGSGQFSFGPPSSTSSSFPIMPDFIPLLSDPTISTEPPPSTRTFWSPNPDGSIAFYELPDFGEFSDALEGTVPLMEQPLAPVTISTQLPSTSNADPIISQGSQQELPTFLDVDANTNHQVNNATISTQPQVPSTLNADHISISQQELPKFLVVNTTNQVDEAISTQPQQLPSTSNADPTTVGSFTGSEAFPKVDPAIQPNDATIPTQQGEESPTSNVAMSLINQLTYIFVPYRWSRVISDRQTSVHYVSPSGRVLFNHTEVLQYITTGRNCCCNLDQSLNLTEVFYFDPNVGALALPAPKSDPEPNQHMGQHCLRWFETLSERELADRVDAVKNYLDTQVVEGLWEMYRARTAGMAEVSQEHDDWFDSVDWADLKVTVNGRVYVKHLTTDQWKHLTWEMINEGFEWVRWGRGEGGEVGVTEQKIQAQAPSTSANIVPLLADFDFDLASELNALEQQEQPEAATVNMKMKVAIPHTLTISTQQPDNEKPDSPESPPHEVVNNNNMIVFDFDEPKDKGEVVKEEEEVVPMNAQGMNNVDGGNVAEAIDSDATVIEDQYVIDLTATTEEEDNVPNDVNNGHVIEENHGLAPMALPPPPPPSILPTLSPPALPLPTLPPPSLPPPSTLPSSSRPKRKSAQVACGKFAAQQVLVLSSDESSSSSEVEDSGDNENDNNKVNSRNSRRGRGGGQRKSTMLNRISNSNSNNINKKKPKDDEVIEIKEEKVEKADKKRYNLRCGRKEVNYRPMPTRKQRRSTEEIEVINLDEDNEDDGASNVAPEEVPEAGESIITESSATDFVTAISTSSSHAPACSKPTVISTGGVVFTRNPFGGISTAISTQSTDAVLHTVTPATASGAKLTTSIVESTSDTSQNSANATTANPIGTISPHIIRFDVTSITTVGSAASSGATGTISTVKSSGTPVGTSTEPSPPSTRTFWSPNPDGTVAFYELPDLGEYSAAGEVPLMMEQQQQPLVPVTISTQQPQVPSTSNAESIISQGCASDDVIVIPTASNTDTQDASATTTNPVGTVSSQSADVGLFDGTPTTSTAKSSAIPSALGAVIPTTSNGTQNASANATTTNPVGTTSNAKSKSAKSATRNSTSTPIRVNPSRAASAQRPIPTPTRATPIPRSTSTPRPIPAPRSTSTARLTRSSSGAAAPSSKEIVPSPPPTRSKQQQKQPKRTTSSNKSALLRLALDNSRKTRSQTRMEHKEEEGSKKKVDKKKPPPPTKRNIETMSSSTDSDATEVEDEDDVTFVKVVPANKKTRK